VFILIKYMHLVDSLTALILPAVVSGLRTFLMRQAFMQMPRDYGEAAIVDGASQWKVFTRGLSANGVGRARHPGGPGLRRVLRNEFFRPPHFLEQPEQLHDPLGLVNLEGFMGTGSVSVVLAAVTMALVPN